MDIINVIVDEFVRVAGKFVNNVRSALDGIFNQASQTILKPVTLDRAKAQELTEAVTKRDNSKPYYPAIVGGNTVAVIPTPFEQNEAIDRLKSGTDTWTKTKGFAYNIAWQAGLREPIFHDIHQANEENIQFEHYHTNPKNGSHGLYGLPFQLW